MPIGMQEGKDTLFLVSMYFFQHSHAKGPRAGDKGCRCQSHIVSSFLQASEISSNVNVLQLSVWKPYF